MEKSLNESMELHQKLIQQGQALNETLRLSASVLARQVEELYKGKTVEIEVFRAEPPFCTIRYHMNVFRKRKKIVGQIKNLIFADIHYNLIRIEFSDKPDDYAILNMIETPLSNLKSIKTINQTSEF